MNRYCEKCGRTLDEGQFYTSNNKEKYPPDGKLNICKKCLTMHVDNWDPETYKWILKEIDVPYIKEEWNSLLNKIAADPEKARKMTGLTILGRYLSKMKLKQWKGKTWEDGERIEAETRERNLNALKAQGLSEEEIEKELAKDHTPKKPKEITQIQAAVGMPAFEEPEDDIQVSAISDELTEEDKMMLRLKWGKGYTWEQRVRMEQLYTNFMNSYDIQGAGAEDMLIIICKTSLKTNELLDAGDIEGAQKVSKVYNDLMKSAKLTAAQLKADDKDEIDSVGELIALCEKEGFVPRYYVGGPKDHVDRTLQDMQKYTRTLVTEELNLGNMLEAAVREIEEDKVREANIETDDDLDEDARFEASLFAEEDQGQRDITNQDYEEFEELKDQLSSLDLEEEGSE